MKYEVEQKFRVQEATLLASRLERLGAHFQAAESQVDRYFAHPSRNFAETDEALRLRRDQGGNRITFKGPRLDTATKTRRELELPLPDGEAYLEQFSTLLQALGFRPVAEVHKQRAKAHVPWHGAEVEVSLDQVREVGEFIELEIVAEASELAEAQEIVTTLAEELQLTDGIRQSYLELLLAARGAGDPRRNESG